MKSTNGFWSTILFWKRVLPIEYVAFIFYKKKYKNICTFYTALECTKTDISRWKYNPCSTHAQCRKAKRAVIANATELFNLSHKEAEQIANSAGLSLYIREISFSQICEKYKGKKTVLLRKAAVSERMFQYYIKSKTPTKQALTAILISLEMSCEKIDSYLNAYGYCLSKSLPNDAIVSWFLQNITIYKNSSYLLASINETLEKMELPLLGTKLIKR